MSQYTPEQILKMIEEHGGPEGLALSGKDLSGIDLSPDFVQAEMKRRGLTAANPPLWFSPQTGGINLQDAELWEANLQKARLQGANLQGTWLSGANLQDAWLWGANLQGTDLIGANLQGASLEEASLQGADLRVAKLQGASLSGADLRGARLTAACLGREVGEELDQSWEEARQVYLALKVNFVSLGQYDDARWAFIKERRMERKANCPWRGVDEAEVAESGPGLHRRAWRWLRLRAAEGRVGLRHPGVSWGWLWDWAQDLFTGYYTRPRRVALLVLATIPFFTLLYWLSHSPLSLVPEQAPPTFVDYLIFSARTLVTLAFSDMTPGNLWAKVLSPIEGAVGVSLFALFVYCLGRRTAGY